MLEAESEIDSVVTRGAAAILAAADVLPAVERLADELECVESACERGYFFPDEEELIRLRYSQYLALRSALLQTLAELGAAAGRRDIEWRERLPVFTVAFATACLLMRAGRFVIDLAKSKPVAWQKLDEEDSQAGIPRKSFTTVYRSLTGSGNSLRFLAAADFYDANRNEIHALKGNSALKPVIEMLALEEPWMERSRKNALKRHFSYRWFSFLRRNRSAWRQVMFGFFEAAGRSIAEMSQPGAAAPGMPKRITADLRVKIETRIRPGDFFVTRHDDALSNLFLPGHWPHAALYLGNHESAERLGFSLPFKKDGRHWFLEAKKDGVRFRPAEETLETDAFAVFRAPLGDADLVTAISRAMSHAGKPYDFLFDFRTADRLACTEVIYRGFHGVGEIYFSLKEIGGRLCLSAEELIHQSLLSGFRVIATGGLRGDRLLIGTAAEVAFHGSRQPI
jgi:hypothetical protein